MIKAWLVCILVVIFAVAGIVLSPSTIGQKELAAKEGNAEDLLPTDVTPGLFTDQDREFSREYKRFFPDVKRNKLLDVAQMTKGGGSHGITTLTIGVPSVPSEPGPKKTFAQFINGLACGADVIALGEASDPVGHLTEDETLAYTEYRFLPHQILKDNPLAPVEIGKSLTITRPGGFLRINGQLLRVDHKSYRQLDVKKSYLLFLRYLPKANGYVVSNSRADFVIDGNDFRSISAIGVPRDGTGVDSSEALLSSVRNEVSTGCARN